MTPYKHAPYAHTYVQHRSFLFVSHSVCVCAHVFGLNVTAILTMKLIFFRKSKLTVGEVTPSRTNFGLNFTARPLFFHYLLQEIRNAHTQKSAPKHAHDMLVHVQRTCSPCSHTKNSKNRRILRPSVGPSRHLGFGVK